MNVLILTEGGKRIGFGHLTRCISLYEAFAEKNITPEIIVNGDQNVVDLLKGKNYRIFNWLKEKDKLFIKIAGAEIAIVDSYLADFDFYKKVSEIVKIPVYIDDYKKLDYPKGIVVNPSIYGNKLNYPKKNDVIYLLGKDYIILRKEFWNVPKKKINKEVKNILIIFGGMNHSDLIHKIVNHLKDKIDFNFYIVEPKKNKLSAKEILNLMLKADICISGGGQTTYELARVGVPTIGICFAKNQILNLEEWQERKGIEYIGWYNNRHIFNKLDKTIKSFLSKKEREKRSRIVKRILDGNGARRIVSKLITEEEELKVREVVQGDCRDLWIWRNHPKVRKWSFNTGKVEYKKHKEWFDRKIKDGHTNIYIAENMRGEKVGQVRFEADKELAYVNVNLNPEFSGKGFGRDVIKKGSELFMRENQVVRKIIAEIIDGNIASKRVFQKAGYVFSYNIFKNNKQVAIFNFLRK